MNPIFDLEPWPRIRASAKIDDVCPGTDSDGHWVRTRDVWAISVMTIGPQTSASSPQRCGPTASIAPSLGSDPHKIPI